jgi:hypothetical protein
MAVGGSIRQAALRLGLPDTSAAVERCHSSARAVHRWAKQRHDPYEFETAVHDLADAAGLSTGKASPRPPDRRPGDTAGPGTRYSTNALLTVDRWPARRSPSGRRPPSRVDTAQRITDSGGRPRHQTCLPKTSRERTEPIGGLARPGSVTRSVVKEPQHGPARPRICERGRAAVSGGSPRWPTTSSSLTCSPAKHVEGPHYRARGCSTRPAR